MALVVWPYGPERHYWMALIVLAYGMGGVAGWRWRTLYVAGAAMPDGIDCVGIWA